MPCISLRFLVVTFLVAVSVGGCRSQPADDAPKQAPENTPKQNAPTGPQAPHDSMVVEALRPCMAVGRVFAKMPPADRLEEVIDACAPALRPQCEAALMLLAQPAKPDEKPPEVLGACAASYCPDLVPGSDAAALCAWAATSPERFPKSAVIMAFFEAALRLDYPAQVQGIEILSGMLISVLLEARQPAPAAP